MKSRPSSRTRLADWASETAAMVRADSPFYALIASFAAVAAVAAWWFDRSYLPGVAGAYLKAWGEAAGGALVVLAGAAIVLRLWRERPDSPWRMACDEIGRRLLTPRAAAGALLFLTLAGFMGAFTTLKTLLPLINPFWADPLLYRLDHMAHLGHEPWRLLHLLLGHTPVTRLIEIAYGPLWMGCVTFFPLYFCMSARDEALRRRFLTAYLMTWIINGAVLACVFMSAGPAFYGLLVGDPHPYGELVRYLDADTAAPMSAAVEQHALWSLHLAHSSNLGAGISAFPSLHVSMALLCAFAAYRIDRRLGLAVWAFAAVIAVGSVHLGWHYGVGVYAVVLLMAGIWRASAPVSVWLFGDRAARAVSACGEGLAVVS